MGKKAQIKLKALAKGFFAYLLLSVVTGFFYWMVVTAYSAKQSITYEGAASVPWLVLAIYVPFMFMDFIFVLFGGYVAGRLARKNEVAHGAIVGGAALVLGFLFAGISQGAMPDVPAWINIATITMAVPLAMLGGILAKIDHSVTQAASEEAA